jgi:hypothetical protein
MAEPGHSYSGTNHKLNVWALKWAERQESTLYSCRLVDAYINNGLTTKNDPLELSVKNVMFCDRLTNHLQLDLDQFQPTSLSVISVDKIARTAQGDRKPG